MGFCTPLQAARPEKLHAPTGVSVLLPSRNGANHIPYIAA